MKIALLVPGFSADAGDWCIPALRRLAQALAAHEEVVVLALRYPSPARRYRLFGAEVVAIGGGERRGPGSGVVWARTLTALAAEHGRRHFDVLHAFWANETGLLAALAGRALGVPAVVSLAGGELAGLHDIGYGGQLALTERTKVALALRLARAVTVGSRLLETQARRRVRSTVPLERIPLGVNTAAFAPPSADGRGKPRVVHVGSLVLVKDQATLLNAAARVRDRGVAFDLEIVGEGRVASELRALTVNLSLADVVRFRGEVPHDALAPVYQGSSLFVLSSRHEAQCMAALEAAACGLPVVGTRVGVVPELEPDAAVAVPVGDDEALGEAIAAVLGDPARRQAMGRAARAIVEQEYDLDRCIDRFRGLYAGPF